MLHPKFQGNRSSGSGEDDFLRFSAYMGMVAMAAMECDLDQIYKLPSPLCLEAAYEIGPLILEEKSFEKVNGRRRATEATIL